MKIFGKIFVLVLMAIYTSTSSYAAYDVVSCDSNADFTANSCSQCFSGGSAGVGDNKGLLSDVWENNSDAGQVLFKEEQDTPRMVSLGGANWSEVTASDSVDFWQYTQALDALYDEGNLGYLLPAGEKVSWIESSLGSAYQLTSNPAGSGENIGLLMYDTATHAVESDGNLSLEADIHRECVLFTSSSDIQPPVTPEEPKELPQTGPEHMLLAFVALLLGFAFLKFRRKS